MKNAGESLGWYVWRGGARGGDGPSAPANDEDEAEIPGGGGVG